jgi:carboxylate-amine ligase
MDDAADGSAAQMTLGIEEEMFLVDAETLNCVCAMPEAFERDAREFLGERFEREMISSMVELVTSCHSSVSALREEAEENRHKLARVAARHGLAVMACGTHPFSRWPDQIITNDDRYVSIAETVQLPSVRSHVCGLHVHVAVPVAERIAVMNRLRPILPLFLAISTSSPFWQGRASGMKSYRTAINNEFPRSGLPPYFNSNTEYEIATRTLVDAGIIPDPSYIWWAIRPSANHPTLELRICDSCTRLEDAIAIAGLFRVLVHHYRQGGAVEADYRGDEDVRIEENRWQAARHGIDARFIGPDGEGATDAMQTLRALMAAAATSVHALDANECIHAAARIISFGTSADRQLTVHADRVACNGRVEAALRDVARHLASETLAGSLVSM